MNVRALTEEESRGMEVERTWMRDFLTAVGSDVVLTGSVGDIPNLNTLLERAPYSAVPSADLVVLGSLFGDVLATELGLHWVVVEDDAGADIALQYPNLPVFVFPRDMILKRVERGERPNEINLGYVLEQLRAAVEEQIAALR